MQWDENGVRTDGRVQEGARALQELEEALAENELYQLLPKEVPSAAPPTLTWAGRNLTTAENQSDMMLTNLGAKWFKNGRSAQPRRAQASRRQRLEQRASGLGDQAGPRRRPRLSFFSP